MPNPKNEGSMHFLQNLVLPIDEIDAPQDLYVRISSSGSKYLCHREKGISPDNLQNPANTPFTLDFSTFFGAFSLSTWCDKVGLEHIGLTLELSGLSTVSVWHENGLDPPSMIYKEVVGNPLNHELVISLEGLKGNKGIIYPRIETSDPSFQFYRGHYWTTEPPIKPVTLTIIMPTFKRESYLWKNIRLISENILSKHQDCVQLLVIDNGQTIDPQKAPEGVRIIPNLNYGGSGGFARGVLETIESGFSTHVLFCDDDILIEPETVLRLSALWGYLDEKSVVGGGMMNLSQKHILQEIGAYYECLHFSLCNHLLDLTLQKSLIQYDLPNDRMNYFGWWFFSCTLKTFIEEGLPFPFFVRSDDIEFGERLAEKNYRMISLLGIGVWHEEFGSKLAHSIHYYIIRNGLITTWLHEKTKNRFHILYRLAKPILYRLLSYRYEQAEYLIWGILDALKGPNYLKQLDPPVLHETLRKFQKENLKDIKNSLLLKEKYNKPDPKSYLKMIRIIISKISLNGHLLPSFLMLKGRDIGDNGYIIESLRSSRIETIFRHQMVLYYEPSLEKGILCRMDRAKFFSLFFSFLKIGLKLLWKHKQTIQEWEKAHHELTSPTFWKRYLFRDEK
ncbi:MAG: glycosyltransferase family 2 protein [Leptospirales bacterium]